jgi:RNA polymerase sigma factor (sigma-70 family)
MPASAHDPAEDLRLAMAAQKGDIDALDALIRRHQPWLLHLAQRMLWNRSEAEDATQEIFLKVVTRLSGFENRSEFRTWLYRIAANHLLDRCRASKSFDHVARSLADIPEEDIPAPNSMQIETALLLEEAKIACTTGMLLCLRPRQRLAFLIGEVLGVTDAVGAEVLDTSPANFRQVLARARRDLYAFMREHCGLVESTNACRCARKTGGFIARGFVTPARLQFVSGGPSQRGTVADSRLDEIRELDRRYAEIFRDQPLISSRDHAVRLVELLRQTGVQWSMELKK